MRASRPLQHLALIAALLLQACGDDDGPPPVALARTDSVVLVWNTEHSLDVLANDDASGGEARLSISAQPQHGSARVVGNKLLYTPQPGWYGDDSLGYELTVGEAGGNQANAQASVALRVEAVLQLSGVASDAPVPGAKIVATLGDRSFTSVADAGGAYQISLRSHRPDDFLGLRALGVAGQGSVLLYSLAGQFAGLLRQASDGALDSRQAPALRITHVSTAVAGALAQRGALPLTDAALSQACEKLDTLALAEAAALIKLTVDHGVPLPSEAANTFELVANAGVLAAFANQQRSDNAARLQLAMDSLADDAGLRRAPPTPAAGAAELELIYAQGVGGGTGVATTVRLRGDGSAAVAQAVARSARWQRDGDQLRITFDEPVVVESYSAGVGSDGLQWLIRYVDSGLLLADIGASNGRYALANVRRLGHTLELGGPNANLVQPYPADGSLQRRYTLPLVEGLRAEDFAANSRWAGPYANLPPASATGTGRQDVLAITGAGSARMERSGVQLGWALADGALELTLPDALHRYRRLGLGALGEERWLMQRLVDGQPVSAHEIMAVRVSGAAPVAADWARRWKGNIAAASGFGVTYRLRADGAAALTSQGPGQAENAASWDRYWRVLDDGRIELLLARNGAGQACNPWLGNAACITRQWRYWQFVGRSGATLWVIETAPYSPGGVAEANKSYRFVALQDAGAPD